MPRTLRTVEPGVTHHVTQRGVDGQAVFFTDADRRTYLGLIEQNLKDAGASVLAYCLMGNHVHWIVCPDREDSLAILFRRVHGRYAQYLNARKHRTGHLWQNRYFSCAVDRAHLWNALRYVELNPVRAGLVCEPTLYRWSSAAAHCVGADRPPKHPDLDWRIWEEAGGAEGWRQLLSERETHECVVELRRCTYSGRPLGESEFVHRMEIKFGRHWQNRGRPKKTAASENGSLSSASFSGS